MEQTIWSSSPTEVKKSPMNMRKCITDSALKLIISSKLEGKIRFLCDKFPHTEWSGILFYKEIDGNLEDKNLILSAEDFYLLDVGTAGYTEYETTPDVLSYQIENDLLDCWWCIIHSHNSMATFFSGTDDNTLNKGGESMNHFLSLIVNNAGEYNARITRIVDEKLDIDVNGTYKSFEDIERNTHYKTNGTRKYLEWIQADIEKMAPAELTKDEINFLEERISTINTAKEEARRKSVSESKTFFQGFGDDDETDFKFNDFTSKRRSKNGINLYDEEIQIKRFVYAIITGDLFPLKSVLACGLSEVITKALRVYNVKKSIMNDTIEFDGGVEMYLDNMMDYVFGLGNGIDSEELWSDMISTIEHYSRIDSWIKELNDVLEKYKW